jgi:hypothetical protein
LWSNSQPVHLLAALSSHPKAAEPSRRLEAAKVTTNMTFLLTEYGKPFTANGFGNKFKDWCRQADLPHCSAHGVRKAASTALAEVWRYAA